MKQLDQLNQKAMVQAAIDNQPFIRTYIEYQEACPYCELTLHLEHYRWPLYTCGCSYWVFNFHDKYKRIPFDDLTVKEEPKP